MNIYWEEIEQVRIHGPKEEAGSALDWCFANGFRTLRSGPRYKGGGLYDTTRFFIIAQRRKPGTKKRRQQK